LATRGRPEIFKRFYRSVIDNATVPEAIEFVTYHDDDDDSMYGTFENHRRMIGPRVPNHIMVNACWREAKGDIIAHLADDFVFKTKGWDESVYSAFEEYDDRILLVWPNDKWYRSNHGSTFFVHQNWPKVLGYLAAPYFVGQFVDNWVNDLARMIQRQCYLRHVVVKHVYADDQVHAEYITRSKAVKSRELYHSEEMHKKRLVDANKLLQFIENYGTERSHREAEIGEVVSIN